MLEDGRVVQRGTPAELLAERGQYEALYRTQFDQPAAAIPAPLRAGVVAT